MLLGWGGAGWELPGDHRVDLRKMLRPGTSLWSSCTSMWTPHTLRVGETTLSPPCAGQWPKLLENRTVVTLRSWQAEDGHHHHPFSVAQLSRYSDP